MKRPPRDDSEPLAQKIMRGMLRPKRIMIVDDDDTFSELIQIRAEQKFSVEVVRAVTAEESEELLRGEPPIDIAILDVRLVGGDGISVYREIVDRYPWVIVVFITGYDHDSLRDKIKLIGPAQIYSKNQMLDQEFGDRLFLNLGCRYKGATRR